jgi:hypothetical protein
MGKKIDLTALKPVVGANYPPPFDEPRRAASAPASAMPQD